MEQHPEFEAGYRDHFVHVKPIAGATGEALDLRTRSIETLVTIPIEYTEDRIVATLLPRPFFGTIDDADRRGPFRVVRDHHLGSGQIEVGARDVEVSFFGLSLTHDQCNRARLVLADSPTEGGLASYSRNVAASHALTV
jgi:hypothetical protein